ncbi:hypothetical protein GF415_02930, partial [Candidatus Micrarchaeota archaeon]|nr:hypothetical protein [Candidatus Micrarchaeota archaeon]
MSEKKKGSRKMSWGAVLTGDPGGDGLETGVRVPLKEFLNLLRGPDGKLNLDDDKVIKAIRERAYEVAARAEEAQLNNLPEAEQLTNEATALALRLPEYGRESRTFDENSRAFRLADIAGVLGGSSEKTRRVDLGNLVEATGGDEEDLDMWQKEVSERLDAGALEGDEKARGEDSRSESENYLLNVGPQKEEGRPVSDSMIEESREVGGGKDETRKTAIHGKTPQTAQGSGAHGLGTMGEQEAGFGETRIGRTPEDEFFGEPLEKPAGTVRLQAGESGPLAGMGAGKPPESGRTDTILGKNLAAIVREGLENGMEISQTRGKPLSDDTIRRMEEDSGRRLTSEEVEKTILQEPGGETADLGKTEDFRPYGDIFYAIKKVFRESGQKEPISFEESLEKAIGLAGGIAAESDSVSEEDPTAMSPEESDSVSEEDPTAMSPELRRVNRLRRFKREFVDVQEDREEPKKSLNQYKMWLIREKSKYEEILKIKWERGEKKIPDAFRILGMSPGEYSRKATLRICNAFLSKSGLNKKEEERVGKLKELLETEEDGIEEERNADLAYEMLVGKATEYQRELSEKREEKIDDMDTKLGKLNITLGEFEGKKKEIVNVLKLVYLANRNTEQKYNAINRPEVKEALMELESDYRERKKWMGLIVNILSRNDEGFKELWEDAMSEADRKIFPVNRLGRENEKTGKRKGAGPVASGIGSAIKMAAGAGILAAGMWLNQQGI